jgi:molecular chaperone DnaJ
MIPAGINDNDNVRYPGLAPGGHDLVINYRVHPHPVWQRNGSDLYCERGVDFWQLILGTTLNIQDIQGKELALTIPPRCRPGTVMRARGRGVTREGQVTGDLLIRLQAVMPDDISQEIIDVLQKQVNK